MKKLPPVNENIQNTAGMPAIEIDRYEVREWHPLPDGKGKPTQVHFLLYLKGLEPPLVIRLKSKDAADTLIESLTRHRLAVWPEGGGQ